MMLAQAGKPLGMRFRFLDPAPDSPAASCGEHVIAPYQDAGALAAFSRGLNFATWEFENVPCEAVRRLADRVPVRPSVGLLELAQDRLLEKRAFAEVGLRTARHLPISSRLDLREALREIGVPSILKTRRMGYDGKGQFFLRAMEDADRAWSELGEGRQEPELILEGFVEFEREVSLIACRGVRGTAGEKNAIVFYSMPTNTHRAGILRVSRVGAGAEVPADLEAAARSAMTSLLEAFDYIGVLAIEFFVVNGLSGRVLVANEMAPRVHNSGHWSIEGCKASQFENHCRAVAGMDLASPSMMAPAAAMVNIVGQEPDAAELKRIPGATVHMYGKAPRAGRKLGHVTIVGEAEEVDEGVRLATRLAGMRPDRV